MRLPWFPRFLVIHSFMHTFRVGCYLKLFIISLCVILNVYFYCYIDFFPFEEIHKYFPNKSKSKEVKRFYNQIFFCKSIQSMDGYLFKAWHMRGLIYSRFLEQLLSGGPRREKKVQRHKETKKKKSHFCIVTNCREYGLCSYKEIIWNTRCRGEVRSSDRCFEWGLQAGLVRHREGHTAWTGGNMLIISFSISWKSIIIMKPLFTFSLYNILLPEMSLFCSSVQNHYNWTQLSEYSILFPHPLPWTKDFI